MEIRCKYDEHRRAVFVSVVHVTEELGSNFYLVAVEIDTIRVAFVETDLIKLEVIAADVGSAYIQEFMREKIFSIVGLEIGKWAGLKIINVKELYGLQ